MFELLHQQKWIKSLLLLMKLKGFVVIKIYSLILNKEGWTPKTWNNPIKTMKTLFMSSISFNSDQTMTVTHRKCVFFFYPVWSSYGSRLTQKQVEIPRKTLQLRLISSLVSHIKQVSRTAFCHLRNIVKIRSILSQSDAEKLLHVTSTLILYHLAVPQTLWKGSSWS